MVRRCISITSHLGQRYTILTVDQALYFRLIELNWSIPTYEETLIPRLEGLHISMNFLKVIGQQCWRKWTKWHLNRKWPFWSELHRKSNVRKGMRSQKLTFQAMWRILLPQFLRKRWPDFPVVQAEIHHNRAKVLQKNMERMWISDFGGITLRWLQSCWSLHVPNEREIGIFTRTPSCMTTQTALTGEVCI